VPVDDGVYEEDENSGDVSLSWKDIMDAELLIVGC